MFGLREYIYWFPLMGRPARCYIAMFCTPRARGYVCYFVRKVRDVDMVSLSYLLPGSSVVGVFIINVTAGDCLQAVQVYVPELRRQERPLVVRDFRVKIDMPSCTLAVV